MITDRLLEVADKPVLEKSLAADQYHANTTADFFYDPRSATKVYEDEGGPILYVRGSKALRVDIQFVDNNDAERNKAALISGFVGFVEQVKANGFSELVFNTDSPVLKEFCKKHFRFIESNNELRKFL